MANQQKEFLIISFENDIIAGTSLIISTKVSKKYPIISKCKTLTEKNALK
jgi:hypothetical protein